MPRRRVLSAGEVCRILQENGFYWARQSGSHIVMKKPTPEGERVAIVPNHREIRQGTLKSVIAQSGLLFLASRLRAHGAGMPPPRWFSKEQIQEWIAGDEEGYQRFVAGA